MASTPLSVHLAGRTDVGLIREHNEDGFLVVDLAAAAPPQPALAVEPAGPVTVTDRGALIVVCDGMGGAAAGEVASSMALETLARLMLEGEAAPNATGEQKPDFARRLKRAALEANKRIFDAARADEQRAGMGTTMTCVGIVGHHIVMLQCGDSRAYVLRDGKLTQVTRDQSLVNQLLELGQINEEQARLFEHQNVILQALGVQEDVEILLSTVPLRRGDRIVVCTDGLTGVVSDEELAAILGSTDDMNEACRLLIEMARAAGGPDNITVVAARFDDARLAPGTADATVTYERWWLDEKEPDPGARPELRGPLLLPPPTRRREDPARVFLSLMLLLALTLGSVVVAQQLYRSNRVVRCALGAAPSLRVHVDGRDVGVRTREGETVLRLPPGEHSVGLRGPGAPAEEQVVNARGDAECKVSFNAPP